MLMVEGLALSVAAKFHVLVINSVQGLVAAHAAILKSG